MVTGVDPEQVTLSRVAFGGKAASRVKKISISLEARNCDVDEKSPPTAVHLRMDDQNGNNLINNGKNGVQCKNDGEGGNDVSFKRDVLFQGPMNCAGSAVPNRNSNTDIDTVVTASAPGVVDDVFTTIVNLHCVEGRP